MRILVERSNVHYRLFQTLVYMHMQSVTLIQRYFIIIWKLSQEKSFNELILSIIPLAKGKLSYTKELLFMISYCFVSFLHLLKNSR